MGFLFVSFFFYVGVSADGDQGRGGVVGLGQKSLPVRELSSLI